MLTSRVVSVDPRVLRVINLQANTEIDYQTYASMLRNAATTARGSSANMTTEEIELITQEFRRARSNAMGVGGRIKLVPIKAKIANISTGRLKRNASQAATSTPTQPLLPSSKQEVGALGGITKSLGNIIQLLTQQNQQVKKDSDESRKTQERARRAGLETNLERGFIGAKVAAQALIAPVKNILDQIIQFFVMMFLGRAVISLLNWFADPQNQSKVKSILRFLSDWWPTLMSAYILFGTGFGRVVRKLAGVAVGAVSRLIIITARLAKAIATGKGLKGAASAVATGGGGAGWKGALVKLGVGALATVGTTMAINKAMSGGQDTGIDVPEAPANPMLGAFGGGLASLGSLFGNLTSSASESFAPFTSFFSNGGLASVMQGLGGVVSGQKGVDKVPAMLTDGEFVMSRGAVQKFGVNTLESMNAAGGGTNVPRIVNQRVHAAGGGLIGGVDELRQKYDAKHGVGAYDKESSRRKAVYAQEDAAAEAKKGKKPTYVESAYVRQLRERAQTQGNTNYTSVNGIRIPGIKFEPKTLSPKSTSVPTISADKIAKKVSSSTQNLFNSFSAATGVGNGKMTPEQQRRINVDNVQRNSILQQGQQRRDASKEARAEYLKILKDQSHPLYEQAAFGDLTLSKFKKNYKPTIAPTSAGSKSRYTPYQSRFAGSRDAAFAKAKSIGGFGGVKSQDYYKANTAAKEKQLSGLTSQQRLSALSLEGKGPNSGPGRRALAEQSAKSKEFQGRGGIFGGIGRGFTRMFGSEKDKARISSQDAASDARVKQAGAASIGRYYSSSDGKYYGNYEQAQKVRQARLASTKPKPKGITPTPKPAPKVVRTKANLIGSGGGGGKGSGSKPSLPAFSASSGSNRKAKNVYGIR